MSWLMSGPPLELDGVPITPDFRNMLALEALLADHSIPDWLKPLPALRLLYPAPPVDTARALETLLWFYAGGRQPPKAKASRGDSSTPAAGGASPAPSFSFAGDAPYIYAAFMQAYGIDLAGTAFLHWWAFLALFEGLPEDTLMRRILWWRTADTRGMDKAQREQVLRMRRVYGQGPADSGCQAPGAARAAPGPDMQAWADERFAQARAALKGAPGLARPGPQMPAQRRETEPWHTTAR